MRHAKNSLARPRLSCWPRWRAIARKEGRQFDEVLVDAMWEHLKSKLGPDVRPEVIAHYYASLEGKPATLRVAGPVRENKPCPQLPRFSRPS